MADVREDILARLLAIGASIPNIRLVTRNSNDIPETQLPAVVVLDGGEDTDDAADGSMRPPHRPTVVTMTPEVCLLQQANEAGSDLNTLRRELIKRVLYDTELNEQIVGTGRHGNGAIRYLGCHSDFGWLRTMQGGLVVHFMFKYRLDPSEL